MIHTKTDKWRYQCFEACPRDQTVADSWLESGGADTIDDGHWATSNSLLPPDHHIY